MPGSIAVFVCHHFGHHRDDRHGQRTAGDEGVQQIGNVVGDVEHIQVRGKPELAGDDQLPQDCDQFVDAKTDRDQ